MQTTTDYRFVVDARSVAAPPIVQHEPLRIVFNVGMTRRYRVVIEHHLALVRIATDGQPRTDGKTLSLTDRRFDNFDPGCLTSVLIEQCCLRRNAKLCHRQAARAAISQTHQRRLCNTWRHQLAFGAHAFPVGMQFTSAVRAGAAAP